MGKVIKILVSTLSIAILTVIGLTILLVLLLKIPKFQNFVVDKATELISEKLGAKVEIGHVKLKFFSRVVLDDIYAEDLHGDTLLYIRKLDVGIRNIGLMGEKLSLGEVNLSGTRFYMHQTDKGISNLAEILAKLKSDKPKKEGGSFSMNVGSVNIEDLRYRYRKLNPAKREYGVKFDDLEVLRLDLRADGVAITGDSIVMGINAIAVKEKSGLDVDKLSAEQFSINLAGKGLRFKRMYLKTPTSDVNMSYLNLFAQSWKDYGDFVNKVKIESDLINSTIAYSSIAYFAPGLKDWQSVYRNVSGEFSGTVAQLDGRISRLSTLDTELSGVNFQITGLPEITDTKFVVDIDNLHTNASDALFLMHDITRKHVDPQSIQIIHRLDNISFTGHFDGYLNRFKADGKFTTSLGEADINLAFKPQDKGSTGFDGHLAVKDFNLGALLENKSLGKTSVSSYVEGVFGRNHVAVNADAGLDLLEFNGYGYHDVVMKGKFENRNFEGTISSTDPNIAFDFDGLLDFNDSLPRYDFDMRLHNADLHKLNFNKRDSISLISCHITAQATGTKLDNMNGQVSVDDLLYVYPLDSVRTGEILLTGKNDASLKSISLLSSFADVQLNSHMGYEALFNSLAYVMQKYIPTLTVENSAPRTITSPEETNQNDYYELTLKVKQANNVAGAILPGLMLAVGTDLKFNLNPQAEKLSLELNSEYLEWNQNYLSNVNINGFNRGDSLLLSVRTKEAFVSGALMPGFILDGTVKDNLVDISAAFADSINSIGAKVDAQAEFSKTISGMQQIALNILPSYFQNKQQVWRLSSGRILYDSTRIDVDSLVIASAIGKLVADGVMSHSPDDTIHVGLSNFNMELLSQFTQRMGYSVSGITNGYAHMAAALGKGILSSNITFDSMKVNNVAVVPLLLDARWDFTDERAKVSLSHRLTKDVYVQAYYRPKDKRYMADVNMHGLDLSLINPLLSGVIKDTKGRADADLHITSGQLSPVINGTLRIPSLTTTVAFTNVAYTLTDAQVEVKDNVFTLKPTALKDVEENQASFDARFELGGRGFSNYNYDLNIRPSALLALGTTSKDNDVFSGKVHASGKASIKGDKRGVVMDITASTAPNSSFLMSLSSKSNISDADFITFITPQPQNTDSSLYDQRKKELKEQGNQTKTKVATSLAINLALTVHPNTDFQLIIDPTMGKGIKARGNGSLNITLNPKNGEFKMYGDYELTEGSYNLNLRQLVDRTFVIEPGSVIKWTGDPANAILDVTALYKVKASLAPLVGTESDMAGRNVAVECRIHLTDRLTKPNISFEVDVPETTAEIQNLVSNALNTPEMMSTQFLSLVVFKNFYADNTGGMGTMSGSATAWDLLTSQFSNLISSDRFNFGFSYKPKDDINSDELDFDFSTAIVSERLFLDVEGNYDFENNSATANPDANNLTGDFAFRYLIDRPGKLQAKFFSRTIDTYDENQGLQETGVGIYYHEDFNTPREIIRNIRARRAERRKNKKAKTEQTINADSTVKSLK